MSNRNQFLYYMFVFVSHTAMVGLGFFNYNQSDNDGITEYTPLLNAMKFTSLGYITIDMVYCIANYNKQYIQFIIHHILSFLLGSFTFLSHDILFVRTCCSISMFAETSSIFLDIESLYKLYTTPDIDITQYTEQKTPFLKAVKILFMSSFLVVRYMMIPYMFIKYYIKSTLPLYEYRLFMTIITAYTSLHAFWLYKLTKYIPKFFGTGTDNTIKVVNKLQDNNTDSY